MSASIASLRPPVLRGGVLAGFIALVHTANDVFTTAFAALLPTLQLRFALTDTTVAILVGTLWMSASLMQPLFGTIACRIGRRAVAAAGIGLTSVLLSLVAVVPTGYLLFPLVLIGGLGSAALHPVGTSIARSAGGRRATLAVGVFGAAGELGFAVGPVLVLYVVSRFGLAATPWLMVPGVLLAALAFVLIPSDRPQPGERCARWVERDLLRGPVGGLTLASVFGNLTFIAVMSAVPLWMVERGAAPDSPTLGWMLATFSLAAGAGAVVAGSLDSPRRRIPMIVGTLVLSVIPLTAMLFVPLGSAAFFALVALAGALLYAGGPLMVVVAQDYAPTRHVSAAGMILGFSTGLGGFLYMGMGWLQNAVGTEGALFTAFAMVIPAAVTTTLVAQRYPVPRDASSASHVALGQD